MERRFAHKNKIISAVIIFVLIISTSLYSQGLSLKGINKNWSSFLNETYVLDCPDCKNARADVTYMFADIKFRDDAFKICEFGEGKNSGEAMSQVLINGKVEQMIKPYWNLFWVYLAHLNLPVWFVGMVPPKRANVPPDAVTRYKALAWEQFRHMGGRHVQSLRSLERETVFAKLAAEKRSIAPADLQTYKGIIVYVYFDNRSKQHQDLLNAFKKKHPDFLVLDAASWTYGASKSELAKFLSDKDLAQYKPKWGIYPKKYTQDLAQRIAKDLGCEIFVIKPLNSGRSNGIILTEKKDLDGELKKILVQYSRKNSVDSSKKNLGLMPVKTKLYDYWKLDRNDSFMVEAYEPSKPITVKDKVYDPSMRVVFVARHDQGKVYVNMLGAYWKIPHKALTDKGTLTEKHKTISVKQPGFSGILVKADDLAKVKAIGLEAFAKIYAKMIRMSKRDRI